MKTYNEKIRADPVKYAAMKEKAKLRMKEMRAKKKNELKFSDSKRKKNLLERRKCRIEKDR